MKSAKCTLVITSLIISFFLVLVGCKDVLSQNLEWVPENCMFTPRDQFTGGVINGEIYVFGGNGNPDGFNLKTTEMFDPSTHIWTFKSSNENNGGQGVEELTGAVFNNRLYVFGAWGGGNPYGVFNFVQEYDPATDIWTPKASKPTTVSGAPAVVYNGEIFVFGGQYANDTGTDVWYDVVEAYNPTSNTWRAVTNMPYTLGMMSVSIIGTKAYVIGGLDLNTNNILQNVIAYDFESNQWTTSGLGTIPTPRAFYYSSSAPVIDNKIFLIGGAISNVGWTITGQDDASITNDVLIYDPSSQSFSSGPFLPQATDSLLALSINNSIYVIGGETDWTNDIRTSAVWKLDLSPNPLGDINGDGQIGLEEAINALQATSGLRSQICGPQGCEIGGVCYSNGDPNPGNTCEVCNSSVSQSSWTPQTVGTTCDDNNQQTINDQCNEEGICSGAPVGIDYCSLIFPATMSAAPGGETAVIYGNVYTAGITEVPGPSTQMIAEVGYGPDGTDPVTDSPNWTWFAASFFTQSGNNDEYIGSLIAPATAGSYDYAFRFSINDGNSFAYCDRDGTANGYSFETAGDLTVVP